MESVIVMALSIVFGALGLFNPRFIWESHHRLAEKAGEPPMWYLVVTRIAGGVLFVLGLLILIFLLFR